MQALEVLEAVRVFVQLLFFSKPIEDVVNRLAVLQRPMTESAKLKDNLVLLDLELENALRACVGGLCVRNWHR